MFDASDRLDLSVKIYFADLEEYIDQTVTFTDFGTFRVGRGGATVDATTTGRNTEAVLWDWRRNLITTRGCGSQVPV